MTLALLRMTMDRRSCMWIKYTTIMLLCSRVRAWLTDNRSDTELPSVSAHKPQVGRRTLERMQRLAANAQRSASNTSVKSEKVPVSNGNEVCQINIDI
jgi:hypothetical protein